MGDQIGYNLTAFRSLRNNISKAIAKFNNEPSYDRLIIIPIGRDEFTGENWFANITIKAPTENAPLSQTLNNFDAIGVIPGRGPAGSMLGKASTVKPSTVVNAVEEVVKIGEEGNKLLKLAKKYGINATSDNTKQLLENFGMKASDWIAKYRKGIINRELGDIDGKTIGDVFDAADSKMRKLILNGRDKFKK